MPAQFRRPPRRLSVRGLKLVYTMQTRGFCKLFSVVSETWPSTYSGAGSYHEITITERKIKRHHIDKEPSSSWVLGLQTKRNDFFYPLSFITALTRDTSAPAVSNRKYSRRISKGDRRLSAHGGLRGGTYTPGDPGSRLEQRLTSLGADKSFRLGMAHARLDLTGEKTCLVSNPLRRLYTQSCVSIIKQRVLRF